MLTYDKEISSRETGQTCKSNKKLLAGTNEILFVLEVAGL